MFIDELLRQEFPERIQITFCLISTALMSFTHLRNVHLSDKARECVDNYLVMYEKLELPYAPRIQHADSLQAQAILFCNRYDSMAECFRISSLSLALVILSILFRPITIMSTPLMIAGMIVILWALAKAAQELGQGKDTLANHIRLMDEFAPLEVPVSETTS